MKHVVISDGSIHVNISGFNHDREDHLQAKLDATRQELAKRDRELDAANHKLEVIAESASDYYDEVQMLKARIADLEHRLGEEDR